MSRKSVSYYLSSPKVILILLSITGLLCLYAVLDICIPFIVGAIVAYLLKPMTATLNRYVGKNWSIALSVTLFYSLLGAALCYLVPLLYHEIYRVYRWVVMLEPYNWVEMIRGKLEPHFNDRNVSSLFSNFSVYFLDISKRVLSSLLNSGQGLFSLGFAVVLSPFIAFYLLYDGEKITRYLEKYVPQRERNKLQKVLSAASDLGRKFFYGQLIIVLISSIFYSIAYLVVGLRAPVTLGIFSGVMTFVPYLGAFVTLLVIVAVAVMQAGFSELLTLVLLIFVVGHVAETVLVTPRVIGHKLGLHPLTTIFSLLLSSKLFGVWGLFLAFPFGVLLQNLCHSAIQYYAEAARNDEKHTT